MAAIFTMRYKTEPKAHQKETFEIVKGREFFAYLAEMGLGKTKMTIDDYTYLYDHKGVVGMLVVAPKSVYMNWINEIEKHFPEVIYSIAAYSSGMGKRKKEAVDYVIQNKTGSPKILLMNLEATRTVKGFKVASDFLKNNRSIMVVDESSEIKTWNSKQTIACNNLGKLAAYRRILTGTPISVSPLDLYAQFEFLKEGVMQSANYHAFSYTYAEITRVDLGPGRPSFNKVTGFQNLDKLQEIIKPHCVRILKRDCLDLPKKTYSIREVPLTKEQEEAYTNIKQLAIHEHEKGDLTVQSALATLEKLRQICSGHLKLDNGEIVRLKTNKLDEIEKIVKEIDNESKVIIWCAFQEDVRILHERIQPSVTYYGPDSTDVRQASIKAFQEGDARFFLSTQQCGGKGITLTRGTYNIYYSNTNKLTDRLQSEDRSHRIGQKGDVETGNVHYIDLLTPNGVDRRVKENNDKKATIAEDSMSNIKRIKTLEEMIEDDPSELLTII